VRYPKRSPLFLQGAPADVVFAVFNGLVKVYCPGADGNRILVHLAGPGDVIGYADFVDAKGQRSQMFEAHALTSCSVALFTRHHLLKVMRELDQNTLTRMLESLNGFWSSVVHRYAVYLSMSLRERLQMVLADLGARFGVQEARGILLTPELAQEELAEMIGSSRPMVSKLLSEMAERSMIACQGRRYILLRGSGLEPRTHPAIPAMDKPAEVRPENGIHPPPPRIGRHFEDNAGRRTVGGRGERAALSG